MNSAAFEFEPSPIQKQEDSNVAAKHRVIEITRAIDSPADQLSKISMLLGTGLGKTEEIENFRQEIVRYDFFVALALIVEGLAALKNVSGAALAFEFDGLMSCVASTGSAPPLGTTIHSSAGLSGECIRMKKSIFCEDTSFDWRVDSSVCERLELRSIVIVPVLRDTNVIGLLELFSAFSYGLSQAHRTILESVAEVVAGMVTTRCQAASATNKIMKDSGDPRVLEIAEGLQELTSVAPLEAPSIRSHQEHQGAKPLRTELERSTLLSAHQESLGFGAAPLTSGFRLPVLWNRLNLLRLDRFPQYLTAVLIGILIVVALVWVLRPSTKMTISQRKSSAHDLANAGSDFARAPLIAVPSNVSTAISQPLMSSKDSGRIRTAATNRTLSQAPNKHLQKITVQEQSTPATAVVRNDHSRLEVEPKIAVQQDFMNSLPNLGDPKSTLAGPASYSVGSSGGIGGGSGGGVGIGTGTDFGRGRSPGNFFHIGNGVSAPEIITQVDPEFSEEARKAKYQGVVILSAIIDRTGRPTNIRVVRGLRMGLNEKAQEALKKWVFRPAHKDGHPVAVVSNFQINFRSY